MLPFGWAAGAFAESSSTTPLLFVLSPGSDPTAALLSWAESKGVTGSRLQVGVSSGGCFDWSPYWDVPFLGSGEVALLAQHFVQAP